MRLSIFANEIPTRVVCVTRWRVANARHSISYSGTGLQGSGGHGDGYDGLSFRSESTGACC